MNDELDRSVEDEALRRQANMDIEAMMDLEDRHPPDIAGRMPFGLMSYFDTPSASKPSTAVLQKLFRLVALSARDGSLEAQDLAQDPDIVQWAVRFRKAGLVPKDDLNLWDPCQLNDRLKNWLKAAEGGFFTFNELMAEGYELAHQIAHGERLYVYCREGNEQPVYPKWQFILHLKKVNPEIREVLRVLDAYQDPWRVMAFFLLPKKSLDNQSPLELIHAGHGDMVCDYAERHAKDDSW